MNKPPQKRTSMAAVGVVGTWDNTGEEDGEEEEHIRGRGKEACPCTDESRWHSKESCSRVEAQNRRRR
jgi:hypothetical protein